MITKEELTKYILEDYLTYQEISDLTGIPRYKIGEKRREWQIPELDKKAKGKAQSKRSTKYNITAEDLTEMYLIKNMTREEIAAHYGCSSANIQKRLKEYNIQKSKKKVSERAMKTQIERYGGTGFGAKEIAKKSKATMEEKYGYTTPFESEGWQKEAREIRNKRYSNGEIEDKISYALNSRSPEDKILSKEKYIATCQERYGVDNAKQAHIKYLIKNKEDFLELLTNFKNKPTMRELADFTGYNSSRINYFVLKWELKDKIEYDISPLEKIVRDFLTEKGIEFETNVFNIIRPRELDIFIPSLGVAIEVNDNWSHNSTKDYPFGKEKTYHLEKTLACKERGIRLIHIFEWELKDLDRVLSSLLVEKTIGARECEVRTITNSEARPFLERNHRQGAGSPCTINYGLYYKDELVQVMNFRKSRNKGKAELELYRLCSKREVVVNGGASRLFKNFVRDVQPKSVLSYCDMAHNQGGIYKQLGFKLSHTSEPNYKWVKGKNVLSRESTQKHKLIEQGFDPNKTEKEIMIERGFLQIFDSGNQVWYNYFSDENEK